MAMDSKISVLNVLSQRTAVVVFVGFTVFACAVAVSMRQHVVQRVERLLRCFSRISFLNNYLEGQSCGNFGKKRTEKALEK